MATQVVGVAGFKYAAVTVNLGSPLHDLTPSTNKVRYATDSLDRSNREVATIGSGVAELQGTIRFHDDSLELDTMIVAGLDGTQVDYYPDIGAGTKFECLLIAADPIKPDPDRAGMGEYTVRVTLRATGVTTDFAGLNSPLI